MSELSNSLLKKQTITFIVTTYLASWTLFLIGGTLNILPIILLGIWSPSLVSLILTAKYFGKDGIKKFFNRFKRPGKPILWLALIFLPAAVHFTGRSLWEFYYYGEIQSLFLNPAFWAGAIIPSFLIAGLGEELGWRGFLLPRLQKLNSPFKASLIIAAVHLFWHLPTYWLGQGMHNVPMIFVIGFVLPWTFIFNWLYNKSNGSLIFAVSFHAISNASLAIVRFMPLDKEVPITPSLLTDVSLPAELAGPYLSVVAVYFVAATLIYKFGNFNKVNTDLP